MLGPTINLKGLGAFLLSRAEFGVTHVEDPTRGTLVHIWRVTVDATTVAREATLGKTVPTLPGQRHAL